MRDIRADLQDRANFLREKIHAAQAQFEKHIEQLEHEHEERLKALKADLDAVTILLGAEQRRLGSDRPPAPPPSAKAQNAAQPPKASQPPLNEARAPTRLADMIGLQRVG